MTKHLKWLKVMVCYKNIFHENDFLSLVLVVKRNNQWLVSKFRLVVLGIYVNQHFKNNLTVNFHAS